MPALSPGITASLVLAPGDSCTVSAVGGSATVKGIYGAPSTTTTLASTNQVFGPYGVPAKLDVTCVSGTADYGLVGYEGVPVYGKPNPVTGVIEILDPATGLPLEAGGQLAAYTGQVATRCRVPSARSATELYLNSHSFHHSREKMSVVTVVLPNFYASATAEVGAGGATSYTVAIEKMDGTRYQGFASGYATGVCADLSTISFDVAVSLDDGEPYYLNVFGFTSGVGVCYTVNNAMNNSYTMLGEKLELSATPLTDRTMSGTFTNTATGGKMFYPLAIVGRTTKPSVLLVGDSRVRGSAETQDVAGFVGHLERSVGKKCGFINVAMDAERCFHVQTGAANRLSMAQYCSHVIHGHGINDANAGTSLANILIYQAAVRALIAAVNPTARQYQTTIYANTTSTDSWATSANQTVAAGNAVRVTLNTSIRTSTAANLMGNIEIADCVETYRDSGLYFVNGVANYYTSDGLHLKRDGEILVARLANVLYAMGL